MNPYRNDAPQFIDRTLDAIAARVDGAEALLGLMSAALGFERIMKAAIWDINPSYTLIDTSFKNSAPVLYSELIKKVGSKSPDEIASKPNADAISFRTAVLRSGLFVKTIDEHRGTLLKLNSYRDVIAHCDLRLMNQSEARAFLLGTIYPLISVFRKEKLVSVRKRTQEEELILEKVTIDFTIDIRDRLEKRLELHRRVIAKKAGTELQKIENLPHPKTTKDQWEELVDCPACGHKAHIRFEVDFDVEDGRAYPVGAFADYLACPYCELRIDDFEELDTLGFSIDKFYEE